MSSVGYYLNKAFEKTLHLTLRYFRRLSKEVVIFLPAIIIVLLLFNILSSQTLFERTKAKAAEHPRDLKAKLVLGQLLYQNNNLDTAEVELQKIVNSSKKDQQTKETAQNLLDKIIEEKTQPEKIREELSVWQQKNENYPNSRDINLKIAFINWKLYRVFEATKHMGIAINLDPNNEVLKKISLALR